MKLKSLINVYRKKEVKDNFNIKQFLQSNYKVWKPKKGDKYTYINDRGTIVITFWREESFDYARYAIGNCFKTEQEANDKIEELKIIQKMKNLGGRENYIEGKNNWSLNCYNHIINYELYDSPLHMNTINIYFDTKEKCNKVIKEIGEERLLRYYFKVIIWQDQFFYKV